MSLNVLDIETGDWYQFQVGSQSWFKTDIQPFLLRKLRESYSKALWYKHPSSQEGGFFGEEVKMAEE